ncbi:hypothetical protein MSAN_02120800 [Mycena sanguinolenta]|uniref:Uncharacterized protein n=1 Tax=Mycena sanguinolenta TaxID=230812 RepID=A0A8H7CJZ3_9AGAR|nr:hypothetical protein MSAN_02120800 [Mycena sanguinolenta]
MNGTAKHDAYPTMTASTTHTQRIGGEGGRGRGVEFEQGLIFLHPDSEVELAKLSGLDLTVQDFCVQHSLGQNIENLLLKKGFASPRALLYTTDLALRQEGFDIGHIAELKSALKRVVGTKLLREVKIDRVAFFGGIGGAGGQGDRKGGRGGTGMGPVYSRTMLRSSGMKRIVIAGGIGGPGGPGGQLWTQPTQPSQMPYHHQFDTMLSRHSVSYTAQADNSDWLFGGMGGPGGPGQHKGGDGGVGEGSNIPISFAPSSERIFGGIGGEGGPGGEVGGQGGTGEPSAWHQPLAYAGKNVLSAQPTRLVDFNIPDNLRNFLSYKGFVTVGGLFEVNVHDLKGLDVGHIATLRQHLENFCPS